MNLLSDLHVPHEQWALDWHFWCLFCLCLQVSSSCPQQKRDYSVLHPQAWTCIYTGHACRHLLSAVPWISEDHLLYGTILCSWADSLRSCCMWFWMSDWSLLYNYTAFLNTHWSGVLTLGYSVIWLLQGWCHVKLLSSRCTFSVHHTTMHQFSVSLHARPHM